MAFEELKESTEGIREQAQAMIESNVATIGCVILKL
jgi:hypothetical protein